MPGLWRAAAVVVLLVAVNCSNGPLYETRDDLAEAVGCDSEVSPSQVGEAYVREAGFCRVDGSEVQVFTFRADFAQERWTELALAFGGLYLIGDGWAVSGERSTLEAVQAEIGGEIE